MKLDLKARHLSLFELAANKHHYKPAHSVFSRVHNLLPNTVTKLRSAAALKKLQLKTVKQAVNCSKMDLSHLNRLSMLTYKSKPDTNELKFADGQGEMVTSDINIDARLEIISSENFDGTDSGCDDLSVADSVDQTFDQKLPLPSYRLIENYMTPSDMTALSAVYYRFIETEKLDDVVEYDVDEEDLAWLHLLNKYRSQRKFKELSIDIFEKVMNQLDRDAHALSHSVMIGTNDNDSVCDDDAVCAICGDDECTNTNAILFCDACNLAVHQECYGIPFVPESQWLCRRCQSAVGADVACCLCPVLGGAVKQTNDGRWAHIVCALWIPEVGFGNIELLEPITKLNCIPAARHRLVCTVCKKNHVGVCIQCMHKNCYKAFHITCAQQVGLYMKIEPLLDSNGVVINVTKTLLCDNHKPLDACRYEPMIDNSVNSDGRPSPPARKRTGPSPGFAAQRFTHSQQKKPSGWEHRNVCHVLSLTAARLKQFATRIPMRDKRQLLRSIHSYWGLKRQTRNGLLQPQHFQITTTDNSSSAMINFGDKCQDAKTNLMHIRKLRHEMEKVRLLLELIRKREKVKLQVAKTVFEYALEACSSANYSCITDDEPPTLSRCPSPTFPTTKCCDVEISNSESISADPPALTCLELIGNNNTSDKL